jgi:hypothetical protein
MKESPLGQRLRELAAMLRSRADVLENASRDLDESRPAALPAVRDQSTNVPAIPERAQAALDEIAKEADLLDGDVNELQSILKANPSLEKPLLDALKKEINLSELYKSGR